MLRLEFRAEQVPRLQWRFGLAVTELRISTWLIGLDDFIHLDLPDTASIMSAVSKISPLHALIG